MKTDERLYIRETGPTAGEEIIFLHAGGVSGWTWLPVMERLESFHCLAPDLPQHGCSANTGPFSIQGAADQIAALIRERCRDGQAHVAGVSAGAQIATALLASAPECVRSAIISSALLEPLPGQGLLTPGMLRLIYRTCMAPLKNWDPWIRLNMQYSAGLPERYYEAFKRDFQTTTESAFLNLMQANLGFRLPSGLENVTLPVLVVVGSKEYAVMHRSARRLAQALPSAQAFQVNLGKGASRAVEHNWNIQAPELFARTVLAWVTGSPLPAELLPLD